MPKAGEPSTVCLPTPCLVFDGTHTGPDRNRKTTQTHGHPPANVCCEQPRNLQTCVERRTQRTGAINSLSLSPSRINPWTVKPKMAKGLYIYINTCMYLVIYTTCCICLRYNESTTIHICAYTTIRRWATLNSQYVLPLAPRTESNPPGS